MISLAGRDIMHSWGKFVFTGMGLGLLIGITLSMAGIYRGMVDDAKVLLDNSGADLLPALRRGRLGRAMHQLRPTRPASGGVREGLLIEPMRDTGCSILDKKMRVYSFFCRLSGIQYPASRIQYQFRCGGLPTVARGGTVSPLRWR